jgi:hypothetical protein
MPTPPVLVRYIFPFSHLLVVAFHFMPAFSPYVRGEAARMSRFGV